MNYGPIITDSWDDQKLCSDTAYTVQFNVIPLPLFQACPLGASGNLWTNSKNMLTEEKKSPPENATFGVKTAYVMSWE